MQTFSNTPTTTSSSGCPSIPTGGSSGGIPGVGSGTNLIYYTFSGGTFTRTGATKCWQCSSGGTPTSSTGPSTGGTDSGPQVSGNRYLYCETSSPNYPNVKFGATIWATSSTPSGGRAGFFVTYRYGSTIGSFQGRFMSAASSVSSTGVSYSGVYLSGQSQTSGTQNWDTNVRIYTKSSSGVDACSLYYISGTSYTGDMAVDYVIIQSN